MSKCRSRLCLALLGLACVPALMAGVCIPVAVTPEPGLGILMAAGVGAIVLVARKVKNR